MNMATRTNHPPPDIPAARISLCPWIPNSNDTNSRDINSATREKHSVPIHTSNLAMFLSTLLLSHPALTDARTKSAVTAA